MLAIVILVILGGISGRAQYDPGEVLPVYPVGGVVTNGPRPVFQWAAGKEATWYWIWIHSGGTYYWDDWVQGSLTWQSWWPMTDGYYTWWVAGWNAHGYGTWSSGYHFTLDSQDDTLTLQTPAGVITSTARPPFSWTSIPGADWYRIWLERGDIYYWDEWVESAHSWIPWWDMRPGVYRWWIQPWSAEGGYSPWSAGAEYTQQSTSGRMTLWDVTNWVYNIQEVDTQRQRDILTRTHFDLYVLEPVVTEKGNETFDITGFIEEIRSYNQSVYEKTPIILAYVDIGQAEQWRWYWQSSWEIGNPSWIAGGDPDGWDGNYPVAFWRSEWQNIVIYGYAGQSHVEAILQAGFDGIYMDWVEAFSDDNVSARAAVEGVAEPADAMLDFIENISNYARYQSPNARGDFLLVAQNASDLYEHDPARYESLIDAIALEAIWYDGSGGFDQWEDPAGYNVLTDSLYPGWTQEVLDDLASMKGRLPIFCCEYAQDTGNEYRASYVYKNLAPAHGFIPYCTRRSLSRLSTTPYPPNYTPRDY